MASRLLTYWRNVNDMHAILRMLCHGAMVAGPILLFLLFVPGQEWNVNGQPMSYAELWRSGVGLSTTVFLGLITFGAWGLAARKAWSRWPLVTAPVLPIVFFPKALISDDLGLVVVNGVITAAAIYGCLFHLQSVRAYLQGGPGDDSAA